MPVALMTHIVAARASELVEHVFQRIVIPLYFRTDLTAEEQTHQRGKPLPYLKVAKQLIREFNLGTVVEIGSMRAPLQHRLDQFNPMCCNDGHSTAHFASTGAQVFTVDADPRSAEVLQPLVSDCPNVHVTTGDGIAFLRGLADPMEFLYLDAWDVIAGTPYAEKHLEAYQAALPRLAPRCIVQIDDTDLKNGGKGRLVIPQMIRDGFELITWGRQAILARG